MWPRSTRKRLDHTARPSDGQPTPLKRDRLSLLALLALMVASLAGCASGDVKESRRFEAQEAGQEAVVPEYQLTTVAQEVIRPAASPHPTMTPAATLARLVLTSSNSGGEPIDELRSVSASAGAIYAAALIANVQPGQTVSAIWIGQDENLIAQSDSVMPGGVSQAWLYFPLQLNGSLPPGNYGVVITVDGVRLESLAFRLY